MIRWPFEWSSWLFFFSWIEIVFWGNEEDRKLILVENVFGGENCLFFRNHVKKF